MLPSPQLDPDTQKFADHLNAYLSGETDDTYAAANYYDYISLHKHLLQSDDPLCNPVLTTIMPLLSRILNLDRYHSDYVKFLSDFLMLVPIKTTWMYFPKDEMIKTLEYPSPVDLYTATVDMVAWRISAGDQDALDFVDNTLFLTKALQRCLSDHSIPARFWTVEPLVQSCDEKLLEELVADLVHAVELVSLGSDCNLSTRYMAITERIIARRLDLTKKTYDKITEVVELDYLADNDPSDPLMYDLTVDFYTSLVGLIDKLHELFVLLHPVLQTTLAALAENLKSKESYLSTSLGALFGKLTYCKNEEIVSWAQEEKSVNAILDSLILESPTHRQILDLMNFGFIPDKHKFFNDHFANRELSRSSDVLPIIAHAIEDPEFFRLFADYDKLSNSALSQMQKNQLYELLEVITRYNHSANYLLSEMPTVVLTYLVEVPGDISHPLIGKHLRSALENLITNKDLDLGVWEQGLKSLLHSLVNGRPKGPQVDVQDKAF